MARTLTRNASDPWADEEQAQPANNSDLDQAEAVIRNNEPAGLPTNMGKGRESLRKHLADVSSSSTSYPQNLKVGENERVLIKFLEDDFFVTYYQHFIREFQGQKRQMTFICLGDDCPLCDIGVNTTFQALINVLDLRDNSIKLWAASANPAALIDEFMSDAKSSPVDRDDLYFEVSKKKSKNGFFAYSLTRVKERDLEEDYETRPVSADLVARLKNDLWTTENAVRVTSRDKLREVAEELSGE